jgi:lipoprotein-anchoring transpeptidase ErfK/SrfK
LPKLAAVTSVEPAVPAEATPEAGENEAGENEAGAGPATPVKPEPPAPVASNAVLAEAVIALAREAVPANLDAVRQIAESASGDGRDTARALLDALGTEAARRRDAIQRLYEAGLATGEDRDRLRQLLYAANEETVFSRAGAGATEYAVQPGDSLWKICQRVRTESGIALEPGLLKFFNKLRNDQIRVGQVLRIPAAQPRLEIAQRSFRMRLYLGDILVREYEVGLGKENRTPAGTFRVATRLVQPPWRNPETGLMVYPGDPEYAIGTRWIGFDDASGARTDLGTHGTNEPESIGKAESLGCVRMRNAEVEELFELLAPGVEVRIMDTAWPGC